MDCKDTQLHTRCDNSGTKGDICHTCTRNISPDGECYCFMYQVEFKELDLKLFKVSPLVYETAKLGICIKELMQKGFYLKKWNKPTKKGTLARFELCKNQSDFDSKYKDLVEQLENLKSKNRGDSNKTEC
jgi:hypothetical protein